MEGRYLKRTDMSNGLGRIIAFLLVFSMVAGMVSFIGVTPADAATRGSQLTGNNRRVYDFLTGKMHEVVQGTLTNTEFTLTYETLLGEKKSSVTAAELGVSTFYKNGGMPADAEKAFNEYTGMDIDSIVNAMLADYPYDLFWFDKTIGYETSGGSYNYNANAIELPETAYTVRLYVSADYSSTGKTGTTNTDPVRISQAVSAEKNVAAVISGASALSDHEKLRFYAEKICDMVSYDNAAAGMLGEAYGDTSQMISVFDGDDSTNVICEGYSKAFKYLCDRTEFSSPLVECYLVSGMMYGGTGAGPHMWNIVVMDDGKTYLADITNCDKGTTGEGYTLLLRGCPTGNASQYTISIPAREEGYYYYPATSISYSYDNITTALFGRDERTLSTSDYEPGHAIDVTPANTPVPAATSTPAPTPEPTQSLTQVPEATPTEAPTTTPFVIPGPTASPTPFVPEVTGVPSPTPAVIKPTNAPTVTGTDKPWESMVPDIEIPDPATSPYENSESSSSMTSSDGTVINRTIRKKNGVTTQEEYRKNPDGSSVTSKTVIGTDGNTVYDAVYTGSDGVITPVYGTGTSPDKMSFMYFSVTEDFELKLVRYVTGLTSATVPATVKIQDTKYDVTGVGTGAFKGCKSLKKITIGKKTKTIEKDAFTGAKKLNTITLDPGSLKTVKKGAFANVSKKTTLKIKAGKSAYKKMKALIKASGVSSKITFKRVK